MKASVSIQVESSGPKIDPRIFGHFLENLAGCLYRGGLLGRDGRVREELAVALEQMGVSCLRWPGGLFADGYHWKDGIGENRPVRPNVFWRKLGPRWGSKDPNHFGTDEFLALCQRLTAEPYININLGRGSVEEAAQWVQYTNGAVDTPMGKLRDENGHADPHDVKLWGIGNETFGWWAYGHTSAANYADRYLEFYNAMSAQDASIRPVAVGTCDIWPDWNRMVLSKIGDRAAYLSVHVYLPGNRPPYLFMRVPGNASAHYSLCAACLELDRKMRFVSDQIDSELGKDSSVRIALDEWNLWWWFLQVVGVWWRMRDAVSVAGMAGVLVDRCERIGLGNLAQAINVLGLIRSDYDRVVKTPLYYVMQMFGQTLQGRRVPCTVDAPTFDSRKLGGIPAATKAPMIGCQAAQDGERVSLMVTQRRYEGPVRVEIEAPGVRFDRIRLLSASSPEDRNTFTQPDAVGVVESEVQDGLGGMVVDMPAASVAAISGTRTG